jgi:trimeric autotransporter adhesin
MKTASVVILGSMLVMSASGAHAQGGAQASSSAAGSTSVQADKSGATASSSTSSSTSAKAGEGSAALSSGTAMNASLSQPVDARKNKPGDQVTAKTTEATKSEGKVMIPRGAKLIGHVTECKQRSKEEKESALGIVFDRAVLKNGEEIPLNVTIRALAAAQTAASSSAGGDDLSAGGGAMGSARSSGGGALGGVRSTAGTAAGAVTNTAGNAGGVAGGAVNSTVNAAGATRGAVGGLNAAGQLTSNSQGVFGLEGLNLTSAASNSTQGSLITSTSKNVHLDSGTQLLLVSQAQASAQSPK